MKIDSDVGIGSIIVVVTNDQISGKEGTIRNLQDNSNIEEWTTAWDAALNIAIIVARYPYYSLQIYVNSVSINFSANW